MGGAANGRVTRLRHRTSAPSLRADAALQSFAFGSVCTILLQWDCALFDHRRSLWWDRGQRRWSTVLKGGAPCAVHIVCTQRRSSLL